MNFLKWFISLFRKKVVNPPEIEVNQKVDEVEKGKVFAKRQKQRFQKKVYVDNLSGRDKPRSMTPE